MKIGILITGHTPDELKPDVGTYGDMFQRLLDGNGFTFDVYPVVDGVFPTGVDAADGWLITGSKHGVYENLPWMLSLQDLIREAHAAGLPMVGICFGRWFCLVDYNVDSGVSVVKISSSQSSKKLTYRMK